MTLEKLLEIVTYRKNGFIETSEGVALIVQELIELKRQVKAIQRELKDDT